MDVTKWKINQLQLGQNLDYSPKFFQEKPICLNIKIADFE